jgi:hypothetical protein
MNFFLSYSVFLNDMRYTDHFKRNRMKLTTLKSTTHFQNLHTHLARAQAHDH